MRIALKASDAGSEARRRAGSRAENSGPCNCPRAGGVGADISVGGRLPSKTQVLIVFIAALVYVFLCAPWPMGLLDDADQFLQLAGAQMIAAGEHPFISFGADYGPLVFYVSFVAQKLGGHTIGAELILDTIGYALAYTLIFINAALMTRRRWIAPLVVLLAIVQLPRFYKYYILLGPSLSLLSMLIYLERPTRARLLIMALGTVVVGLFRPDMGAYSLIAALLAIRLVRDSWRGAAKSVCAFLIFTVLLCSPWLIFLAWHHGLLAYFRDSIVISATHARGLADPLPLLNPGRPIFSTDNMAAMAFAIWWAAPVLGAGVLIARWKQLDVPVRHRAIVTLCFAVLCLQQSDHRSDYRHLIQAIAVTYVVAAFAIDQLMDLAWVRARRMRQTVGTLAMGLGAISLAAGLKTGAIRGPASLTLGNFSRYYFCDRQEFLRRVAIEASRDKNEKVTQSINLIRYIDKNTGDNDRVLLVSYLTQIYYLSDRRAAGGQIFLAPGFFSGDSDERAIIQTLQAQHNPMVIESLVGYDRLESRRFRSYEPKVFEYLKTAYRPVAVPGLPETCVVWLRRRL